MIEETGGHSKLILACGSLLAMAPVSSELRSIIYITRLG